MNNNYIVEKEKSYKVNEEYPQRVENIHSDEELLHEQNMKKNIVYQSKNKSKVKVILEFAEVTEEAKKAENEFISLLKSVYLDKVLKNYMQEEE